MATAVSRNAYQRAESGNRLRRGCCRGPKSATVSPVECTDTLDPIRIIHIEGRMAMRHVRARSIKPLNPLQTLYNRRRQPRAQVDFGLMYSAQDTSGEVLIGDGSVTDLSRNGLCISGTALVPAGMELTLFLYLPDGQDPLFVMETRVAWSSGHRFGVTITRMNLREQNRLRYFLATNLHQSLDSVHGPKMNGNASQTSPV